MKHFLVNPNLKMCLRPMPQTGTQDRDRLRRHDNLRCHCGQRTCRDYDLYAKEHAAS